MKVLAEEDVVFAQLDHEGHLISLAAVMTLWIRRGFGISVPGSYLCAGIRWSI